MRFIDTMSLHIMCSGFTHAQRLQYQAFEKNAAATKNDDAEISEEDELDSQYLSTLLANEKEKDFKAYAAMRNMKVRLFESDKSKTVLIFEKFSEFEMEIRE